MTQVEETQNTQENIPNRRRNKKKGKKKGLVALLLLLLVIAAGAGGWYWYNSNNKMDDKTKYWFDKFAEDGTLEGKTPVEIQGILNSIVEEGMFNVSVNARAVFPDGKSEGVIGLQNVPENRYYCRVSLTNDDDGAVLYESQGLKPGQFIEKVKLKKNLAAGEYPCTALFIITDPESLDDIGQVRVKMQVIVLN